MSQCGIQLMMMMDPFCVSEPRVPSSRSEAWAFASARVLLSLRQPEYAGVEFSDEMRQRALAWTQRDTQPERCYGTGIMLLLLSQKGFLDALFATPIVSTLMARLRASDVLAVTPAFSSAYMEAFESIAELPTYAYLKSEELVHTLTVIAEVGEYREILSAAVSVSVPHPHCAVAAANSLLSVRRMTL